MAVQAVNTAKETVHDLRVAEVVQQDLDLGGGEVTFRTKLSISFKYELTDPTSRASPERAGQQAYRSCGSREVDVLGLPDGLEVGHGLLHLVGHLGLLALAGLGLAREVHDVDAGVGPGPRARPPRMSAGRPEPLEQLVEPLDLGSVDPCRLHDLDEARIVGAAAHELGDVTRLGEGGRRVEEGGEVLLEPRSLLRTIAVGTADASSWKRTRVKALPPAATPAVTPR